MTDPMESQSELPEKQPTDTIRFSISLKSSLLAEFDKKSMENGTYDNRSEAIRDLIRAYLVKEEWKANEEVVGAIILLYDHDELEDLTRIQHGYHRNIQSTMHIHLDETKCVEVAFTRGTAQEIQELVDKLKGVAKHVDLAITSTGKNF